MRRLRVTTSKMNNFLLALKPDIHLPAIHVLEDQVFFVSFQEYVQSQVQYFMIGDLCPSRRKSDYLDTNRYITNYGKELYTPVNSFVLDKTKKVYSQFLLDIAVILINSRILNEGANMDVVVGVPSSWVRGEGDVEYELNGEFNDLENFKIFERSVIEDVGASLKDSFYDVNSPYNIREYREYMMSSRENLSGYCNIEYLYENLDDYLIKKAMTYVVMSKLGVMGIVKENGGDNGEYNNPFENYNH